MTKNWRRIFAVFGLALTAIVALAGVASGQGGSQAGPLVEASISGSIRGNTAIYSVTLKNVGSAPLQDIFVAVSVPQGSVFQRALDTPTGSWFRGYEGAGTNLQSAVWLVNRIPANSTLGPFTYVTDKGSATDLRARAYVHYRLPGDGTAVSPDVELLPTAASVTQAGSTLHETHVKNLGLSCNTCHGAAAASFSDPLASVTNPVDKDACLGCHSAGPRPFYGDDWEKVRIR